MNTSFERGAMNDEWLTPRFLIDSLGPFDLDPCASVVRPWPTAKKHYTIRDNGLLHQWSGFVWCNPPYGKKAAVWLKRMAEHNNGLALIFARTETAWWHDSIFPAARAVLFIRGRLTFVDTKGRVPKKTAGSPSALVAYGREAKARLFRMANCLGYFMRCGQGTYAP